MYRLFVVTIATFIVAVFGLTSAAVAAGPPFELSVKRDRFIGGSKGVLLFDWHRVEYRTTDGGDARRWSYDQVKQFQILSPTRLAILTYEDQGGLKFGADRAFQFTVVQSAVSPDLVRFLLDRVRQPIVTAVMPPFPREAERLFTALVKHERQGRGSEGALVLYDKELLYLTEREESRYWRFGDIYSVLRLDRWRLQITVYEGGGGDTRTFVFQLKSDLPEELYDALWARVNPSSLPASSATSSTSARAVRD